MKTFARAAAALAVAMSAAGPAHAGPATEALSTCLVQSSTGKDRIVMVQWFFAALSAHPNVKSMSTLTPEQRAAHTRQAAEIMQRLILSDCLAESRTALAQDGDQAISAAFEGFGGAAANELMSDAGVAKEMNSIADYVDEARWEALFKGAAK